MIPAAIRLAGAVVVAFFLLRAPDSPPETTASAPASVPVLDAASPASPTLAIDAAIRAPKAIVVATGATPPDSEATYRGAETCTVCHANEHDAWKSSQHAVAMQNWNFMCADCHSTNLRKNYDAATRSYRTTWSDIDVSCEACHGPGSNHRRWANKEPGWEQWTGAGKGLAVALDQRRGASWNVDPASGNAVRSSTRTESR